MPRSVQLGALAAVVSLILLGCGPGINGNLAPVFVTSLTVTPSEATVQRGSTADFTVSALLSDGSTSTDYTDRVQWSSSDETVGWFASAGVIKAVAMRGAATQITATVDGISSLPATLYVSVFPSGTISTYAGTFPEFGFSGDGGSATSARLNSPTSVAIDSSGNVYISDTTNHRVRMVTPAGVISTVVGTGTASSTGDGGAATAATIRSPTGITFDASGNLYIAQSNRIRRVTPAGIISTIAGTGTAGFSGDSGAATSAQLSNPTGVTVDPSGNIYIADSGNNRIRKITAGTITTVVGTGTAGYAGDGGLATAAQISAPNSIAFDSSLNMYIVDAGNYSIQKVDGAGVISTLAGTGAFGTLGDDGPASAAQLLFPHSIVVNASDEVLFSDAAECRLRKIGVDGIIRHYLGTAGTCRLAGDGGLNGIAMGAVRGIALGSGDSIYFVDSNNHRVRKYVPTVSVTTIAGIGLSNSSGDGEEAASARFSAPIGLAIDTHNNLFVGENSSARLRKIDSKSRVTTFAGTGRLGTSGDGGPAASAQIFGPTGVEADRNGNIVLSDQSNRSVRLIDPAGILTTIAGTLGVSGFAGDGGPATAALFGRVYQTATDSQGNRYIIDNGNHRIRKLDQSGTVTTYAGTGTAAFSGDGGLATSADLNAPIGLVIDSSDFLYFADRGNHRIRRIDLSSGIISTYAGTGVSGTDGNGGLATAARIQSPFGLLLAPDGYLYFSDGAGSCVRRINSSGVISAFAGTCGTSGYGGDGGVATSALLTFATNMAQDSYGNTFILEQTNNILRVVWK